MTAIAVLVAFLAGAITGVGVLLRVGMASEDPARPLAGKPPTRSAAAARRVAGLCVLTPPSGSPACRISGRPGIGQRQVLPAIASRR
jgi:hypothetical protein